MVGIYTDVGMEFDAGMTEIRIDMVAKEAWAFPCMYLTSGILEVGANLLRLDDGSELVLSEETHIETMAEGQLWKDVVGGPRLPASVLDAEKNGQPSFATGCIESHLPTGTVAEVFISNEESYMAKFWRDEKMMDTKLMLPEKRTGDDYLSLRPVEWYTPEGWDREDGELVRI
ncbi:hypothetical protein BDV95DRAFT_603570 [Massariosphaeria phaeospora]|uniref:Uncharacterized protein n=1 Tax=Massariosphaeria phaeospora TaxID=100035 RepID=A0A7C8IAL6_9PLEO|nr:hypothetical protein BDV95DRAFT_603570 [Massariosphaeria phaeospora]